MPTLSWIGKEAVAKHHKEVPFRLLDPIGELSCGDAESGNLIVQGDNLHALKALLPRYAGQVKCIYIDPPYNTGNEGWIYNDNVNSPEIRKWLGEVVGKEGETLDRHDRWLCMMYPRLLLLKQFLRKDGAIFISIDDNEAASLRLLMDEIFGPGNFITTIIWQKIFSPKNSAKHFSEDHDFVIAYALNADIWKPNLLPRGEQAKSRYRNPDNDPRGSWTSGDLQARNYYSEGTYPVTCPSGRVIPGPGKGMYWRVSKTNFKKMESENRIWWGESGNNMPRQKRYLSDVKDGVVPQTMWFHKNVGHTQEAKKELLELVDFDSSDEVFITPKPTRLIQRILQIATDKDSLVLDSFSGSGTTGHAVLKQNVEDRGSRRFIMIEMDQNIAEKITIPRIKKASEGYTNTRGKSIEALGGGLQYYKLSAEPLFKAESTIREDITFEQLAEFVWFMESGTGLDQSNQPRREKRTTPYLGQYKGRAVFLLYNNILNDKSDIDGNFLNGHTLNKLDEILPDFEGPRIVYSPGSRLDKSKLAELGITFHQLPYELAAKTWF